MFAIHELHPNDDGAQQILRAYLEDVASRYHARPLTPAEVEAVVAEFPSDDLTPPQGTLLVATLAGTCVGCVGLRVLDDGTAEVTRLYVAAPHRHCGLGNRLMAGLEQLALRRGIRTLRLDTRDDLIEARALYSSRGYREVDPFNSAPYAEHWFEKMLP